MKGQEMLPKPTIEEIPDDNEQKNQTINSIGDDMDLFLISMATWTGMFGLMLNQQWQQKYRQRSISKKKVLPLEEQIQKEFHNFLDVFSEEKAAFFPKSGPWDHKIELKDTFTPKSFKMYNLTPKNKST